MIKISNNILKKKILVIAFEFYPLNTGGSHRPFRIAKYLKEKGFEPVVVCATIDESEKDFSLQKQLEIANIQTHYISLQTPDYYSNISKKYYINIFDDIYRRWKKNVITFVQKLNIKEEFSSIIITVPNFGISQFIYDLKKYNIPIILDLRDAWSLWNISPYATRLHFEITKIAERKAISSCDYTLVTSQVTIQDLQLLHPNIPISKFIYLPNSFDNYISTPQEELLISKNKTLKIGYVGSFYFSPESERLSTTKWYKKKPYQWFQYIPYREEWLYRSPYFVFKSVRNFIDKHPEYKKMVEFHFAGKKPHWLEKMIEEFSLQENIVHHGIIEKSEVEKFQNEMDLLLITSSKRHLKPDYSIAGKTFEYFSQIKPILAFVTEGAQKDILYKSGIAIIMNPDDEKENVIYWKKLLEGKMVLRPNYEWLDAHKTDRVLAPMLGILSSKQTLNN